MYASMNGGQGIEMAKLWWSLAKKKQLSVRGLILPETGEP